MPKYDNVLVVLCSIVIGFSGKIQNTNNLRQKTKD